MIPFHKPYPLSSYDRSSIYLKIENIIQYSVLTNGYHVRQLEQKIAKLHSVDMAIATSSCTQALNICLQYLPKIMERDRIGRYRFQAPAFTWQSIEYILNATPFHVFHNDIDKKTWLTTAYFPYHSLYLHTFGNIGISDLEDTIYDGSHCLGAEFKDIGLATCISLAPTKLITSMEGGMILTNDTKLYNFAREYRDKCCRMSEIHAIFGIQYLKYIDKILEWKKGLYETYKKNIPGQFQEIPNNSTYNTIGFLNTEKLKIPKEIETRQYYIPLRKGLKNTDFVYENMVCLPSWYNCPFSKIINIIKLENEL